MSSLVTRLVDAVGAECVRHGDAIGEDYSHDESLTTVPHAPDVLVLPRSTQEVSAVLELANSLKVPVVARGGGTGLSGGCVPMAGGIVLSLERMSSIVEIDRANHVAVVEAGVRLSELYEAVEEVGLYYPLRPGEPSATIGGNVATNAGGMRAVKYGVTRQYVLALQAVLADGTVIETGGRYTKVSTGYDLTQLLVGSEGTLAVVTQVTLRLLPRPTASRTLIVLFRTLATALEVVPELVRAASVATIEYMEEVTLTRFEKAAGVRLALSAEGRANSEVLLMIVCEGTRSEQVEQDAEELARTCVERGAEDALLLEPRAASELARVREASTAAGKTFGIQDQTDVVVPRARMARFVDGVRKIAAQHGTGVWGAGHAGDGNIHLAYRHEERDAAQVSQTVGEVLEFAVSLGGAISAEHGVGADKRRHHLALADPRQLELMRSIKQVFDPNGILNPQKVF